mgnify:CR=1 FL=1
MRDIGVDVKTPVGEWDGSDSCPFYGSLRVRGQIIGGTVSSSAMTDSIVVERETSRYMKKYERYEKRTRRYAAHLPSCIGRSEEHTSELQSRTNLVCRLLLEKKNNTKIGLPRVTIQKH